jgi:Septum formation
MLIIIAAVIGAVILVVAVASLLRGNGTGPEGAPADRPAAGTEGVIAQGVQPVDLQQADCMRDFVDANQPVTVVSCESPHNAQLVATFIYPEEDDFPGRDALAARGQELCGSVDFSATVDRFQPLSLTQARPTEESWQEGDRRVDCIVFSEEGNVITESLIG